jgi:shikimate kinase
LEEQEKRPLISKLNHAELLFFIEKKLKEREPFYSQAKMTIPVQELNGDIVPEFISTLPVGRKASAKRSPKTGS